MNKQLPTKEQLRENEEHFLKHAYEYCLDGQFSEALDLIAGVSPVWETEKIDQVYNWLIIKSECQWRMDEGYMRDVKACSDKEAWDILTRNGKETPAKMSDIRKELAKGLRSYAADSEHLSAVVVEYAAETISADDAEEMRTAISECRDLLGCVLHPLFEEKSYATQKLYDLMRFWEERLYQEGAR